MARRPFRGAPGCIFCANVFRNKRLGRGMFSGRKGNLAFPRDLTDFCPGRRQSRRPGHFEFRARQITGSVFGARACFCNSKKQAGKRGTEKREVASGAKRPKQPAGKSENEADRGLAFARSSELSLHFFRHFRFRFLSFDGEVALFQNFVDQGKKDGGGDGAADEIGNGLCPECSFCAEKTG